MNQNLTTEQKRAIASLETVPGYSILLENAVRLDRDSALERLKLAHSRDEITDAALAFRTWDIVYDRLKRYPNEIIELLKEEGDQIYG